MAIRQSKAIREQNERKTIEAIRRDHVQRDRLVFAQIDKRKTLQNKFDIFRNRQIHSRPLMPHEIIQSIRQESQLQEKEARRTQVTGIKIHLFHTAIAAFPMMFNKKEDQ